MTTTTTPEQLRGLVRQAVQTAVPETEKIPAGPGLPASWGEPQPLAGLRAAQAVIGLAQDLMYRYARDLRGEGRSWVELADLLEVPWSAEYRRVERAYELVAGITPTTFSSARVYWTCGGPGGCGEYVTDRGPYERHPDDNEDGHAPGCSRHAAEVEAYLREQAEIEARAEVMDEAMAKVTDPFGQETVKNARYVLSHGGRYLGWSTSETLAVALVLQDDGQLKAQGYSTQKAALGRVLNRPSKPADLAWLRLLRAAATGMKS